MELLSLELEVAGHYHDAQGHEGVPRGSVGQEFRRDPSSFAWAMLRLTTRVLDARRAPHLALVHEDFEGRGSSEVQSA